MAQTLNSVIDECVFVPGGHTSRHWHNRTHNVLYVSRGRLAVLMWIDGRVVIEQPEQFVPTLILPSVRHQLVATSMIETRVVEIAYTECGLFDSNDIIRETVGGVDALAPDTDVAQFLKRFARAH